MDTKTCFECGKDLTIDETNTEFGIVLCNNCASDYGKYMNGQEIEKQSNVASSNQSTQTTETKTQQTSSNTIMTNPIKNNIDANFWVKLLKTMTTIILAIFLIASLAGGIFVGYNSDSFAGGLLVFLGLSFLSFLSVSLTMVFLHLAEDVSIIRKSITKDK